MKNNKLLNRILLGFAGLFLLTLGLIAGAILVKQNQNINEDAAPASSLYISPNAQEVGQDNNFNFNIKINTAENLVSGIDLRIKFDKNIFEIISLEKGQNISDFNNILTSDTGNSTGEVKYVAFTLDKSKAIQGNNLDLLKVNAKVKGNAPKAMYTIELGDQTAVSGLTETENVVTGMTSAFITVIDHTETDSTYVEGEPNNCGGTCGSNNNCKANLYCYKGFCRNPICSEETDCDCTSVNPTITPTSKAVTKGSSGASTANKTPTPKSSPKSTPNYTGGMTLIEKTDELTRDEESQIAEPENIFVNKYAIYIVTGFGLIVMAVIIYALKKKKTNNIPHIVPPTNI